jgi:hypothetical protein
LVYNATHDVVRRVMPLLDLIAVRTVDKARLLQYLSARAGVDWGVLEMLMEEQDDAAEIGAADLTITFRDRATGVEHRIRYPSCLSEELAPLVLEEYKRLAGGQPLTMMAQPLFDHFYRESHCRRCAWRGPAHRQFHQECRFHGRPVNFEEDPRVAAPTSQPEPS